MKSTLPLFEFIIDDSDESGVKAVSIVSDPAFGSQAIFLSKNKPVFIALADKKKQIVAGFSLLPNVPVYRVDAEVGEYLGFFSPQTIVQIVDKFHAEMLSNRVNIEHNDKAYIDAYLVEDFIVDTQQRVDDLASKGLKHPNALGAWYTAFKIKDPEVFQAIVDSGEGTGFSVEAFLERVYVDFQKQVKNKLIDNKVRTEMKKINKSLKEKILAIFTEAEKFERTLVPELAFEIEWSEIGAPVNKVIVNEDGSETLQPVGQGEFVTEEGIVVVDEASNLVEVRELPAEPVVETPEVPEASGDTSSETVVEEPAIMPEMPSGTTGQTETSVQIVEAVEDSTLSGATKCKGIEKSILEVVGTTDGDYNILVKVENGVVTSATAQSMVDLMLSKDKEILELKEKNAELDKKVKEPIADPILTPEQPVVDFNKLSAYEKLMYNKGLKAVK